MSKSLTVNAQSIEAGINGKVLTRSTSNKHQNATFEYFSNVQLISICKTRNFQYTVMTKQRWRGQEFDVEG